MWVRVTTTYCCRVRQSYLPVLISPVLAITYLVAVQRKSSFPLQFLPSYEPSEF